LLDFNCPPLGLQDSGKTSPAFMQPAQHSKIRPMYFFGTQKPDSQEKNLASGSPTHHLRAEDLRSYVAQVNSLASSQMPAGHSSKIYFCLCVLLCYVADELLRHANVPAAAALLCSWSSNNAQTGNRTLGFSTLPAN
jgi:hypothetical protein